MERQRLDKWLWHARVVKARSSAAALVGAGHVRVNGAREKAPGHAVKAGDVLTIGLDRTVRILKVLGFSERRGDAPAEAASALVAADAAPAAPRDEKSRPPRERFQGKGREGRDKGKFAGKPKGDREGGRSGGGPSHRQYASSAPPRERERPVDPNSPLAKLAALKEQLTAARKE